MEQDRTIFDKETFLDLTVNIIPLFIMAFFFVLFLPMVYGPFGWDSTYSLLQIGLIAVPIVGLALLTYFSAIAIEGDEREREAQEESSEAAAPEIDDESFGTDDAESGVAVAVDADEEEVGEEEVDADEEEVDADEEEVGESEADDATEATDEAADAADEDEE